MKKKVLAILIGICLIAVSAAAFTACGENDAAHLRYAYYSFDLYGDGLVLSVGSRSLLPGGDLTVPQQSFYYPDKPGGEVVDHDVAKPIIKIADGAFNGIELITSVTFGENIKELGEGCFENCTGLQSVTFPSHKKSNEAPEIAIPANAFKGCNNLRKISGNPVVTSVGDRAFYGCLALSDMEFQYRGGYSIGDEAFYYCVSLHSFDVSSAGEIGTDAFKGSGIDGDREYNPV